MTIRYAKFEVSVHGLELHTQEELDHFARLLKTVVLSYHPNSMLAMDSDVEIELVESAGAPE